MILRVQKAYKALVAGFVLACFVVVAQAAPYSAVVMDARNGKVLYSNNANQKLHPASLTKMMTIYIAFAEVNAGRISLDSTVTISSHAASQPPSKIGLRAGQKIKFKYLLRAAAVKSANDAATAIAEAIAGSQSNFSSYMNSTAAKLGMRNTRFSNPHGLTANGHYSTAMDMAILGRHMIYDYPRYYSMFGQHSVSTPLGTFNASNIRFLRDYPGADGIKTGYTRAAGYNLVATAKRGSKRVLVSMFGGQSSYQRNEQVGALLDLGFMKTGNNVKVSNLSRPRLSGAGNVRVAKAEPAPAPAPVPKAEPKPAQTVVSSTEAPKAQPKPAVAGTKFAPKFAYRPAARNTGGLIQNVPTFRAAAAASAPKATAPATQPAATGSGEFAPEERILLDLVSSDNGQSAVSEGSADEGDFAIQLDAFDSKDAANNKIAEVQLAVPGLEGKKTVVVSVGERFRPHFSTFTQKEAYNACAKISGKCFVLAPG